MLYEVGPIRPPSEVASLLIRVTRNCPWNKCRFCPVYKGQNYGVRSLEDVLLDIDFSQVIYQGEKSVFLQDADAIKLPTQDLVTILRKIKDTYPKIKRITTYGRSSSIVKKSLIELKELYGVGLTRIHCGLETGYDSLLRWMKKGANAKLHVKAGKRIKQTGISLCEYVMPGLGGDLQLQGQPTWKRHAEETARALNEINPDYIRLRTLAVVPGTPLYKKFQNGEFNLLSDQEVVKEIRYFLENLNGISSQIKSDHNLNVLMGLQGKLPRDKEKMFNLIDVYLSLSPAQQKALRAQRIFSLI